MSTNDLICYMSLMKRVWAGNIVFYALNMGINLLPGDQLFLYFYFLHQAAPAVFGVNVYVLSLM